MAWLTCVAGAIAVAMVVGSCGREAHSDKVVTLYVSADEFVSRPVIEAFEKESGITVLVRGDTEATKTTGLVERLRAERPRPRADVFWSSEVFLTIALANEGILAPAPDLAPEGWPSRLIGAEARWVGFGQRARVCVFNSQRVQADEAPRTMHDLLRPEFCGRFVMARPAFGTTRGHMAAALAMWGEAPLVQWMRALREAGVRFVDGNSAVVRAVANGEADVGLTDTDDVWSGQRLGWPVAMAFIRHELPGADPSDHTGPLVIPNTVSIVAGGPHPEAAKRLARFLLSEQVERLLGASDSHNAPVRESVAADHPEAALPAPCDIPFDEISSHMSRAMELVRQEWAQ